MKNLKRSPNIYSASNVYFDTDTLNGVSYNWWYFVRKMHGKVIFNEYRYSNTTSKHQCKVRSLMQQLGIKIDIVVNVKESLTSIELKKMTLKQLKAESDRQIAERESEKKNRQKIKRLTKRFNELGLYHTNGTPVDPWIEAASIVRGV